MKFPTLVWVAGVPPNLPDGEGPAFFQITLGGLRMSIGQMADGGKIGSTQSNSAV